VLLLGTAVSVPNPTAFAQDIYAIRVESNQVLVPTIIFDKDRNAAVFTPPEAQCGKRDSETFLKLRPDEPFIPADCAWDQLRGFTAKDFHVFEDGVEQKIQEVTLETPSSVTVRDNVGHHVEYSHTPGGKWSQPDESATGFTPAGSTYFYRIAYSPHNAEAGKCHKIKVRVGRHNAFVFARNEYCFVQQPASNPLKNTKLGAQMEGDATSGQSGKISLNLQASFFFAGPSAARVDIALEFPWKSLSHERKDGNFYATIGVLGLVYSKNSGALTTQFSDLACCRTDFSKFPNFQTDRPMEDFDLLNLPTRYEAQIDLAPGEYQLQVVLSDGSKFGRVETSIAIEPYDDKQLAISTVALCKRFRPASVATQEAATVNLAPKYVPLLSKGVQFTPTGDTRFKKGEPLFAYFEVYEPLLSGAATATTVQTQLKITDVKTGEVKVDIGSRSAADWMQQGKSVIPIAEQIAVDKLPAGSYRLEVQTSDSAGKSTVWRTASFTIE